jgi:hypothetical protein
MGSPPQLKAKCDLNYRRGTTSKSSQYCNHFMSASEAFAAFSCDSEPRCKIMGVEPGRAYRINPNNICDKDNGSDYLKRIKAGTSLAENDVQI